MSRTRAQRRRKTNMSIFDHLYEIESFDDRLKCAYCGDVRECLDHVPPITLVAKIGTKELRKRGVRLIKLPSCSLCNSDLGSKPLATYGERLAFLYGHTSRKINNHVMWGDDEIDEDLTGELQRMIGARQQQFMRDVVQRFRGIERNLVKLGGHDDAL